VGTRKGGKKKPAKTPARKKPVTPKTKQVTFQWTVTEANAVTVVGDFNAWDPHARPLRKGKEGRWQVILRLKPGTYEYMFVVDGEWREDPLNPNRIPNPHGGFNSVREVL
jgi:1,4-alpha-glucan branching enzyme